MKDKLYKIKVIIVTFNSEEVIETCLKKLSESYKQCYLDVVVVDNGSSDSTLDILAESQGRYLKYQIVLSENLGWGHANNIVLKDVLEKEANNFDAVLLLNPDAEAPKGALDVFADVLLSSSNRIAGISPYLVESTGRIAPMKSLFGKKLKHVVIKGAQHVLSDRLHGAFMLISVDALIKVGLIDENYFLYMEEVDWCVRAKNMGYTLLISEEISMLHRVDSEERPHRIYYQWRNEFYFTYKNFKFPVAAYYLIRRFFLTLPSAMLSFFRLMRWDLVKACVYGVLDGVRFKKGKSKEYT